MKKRKYKFGIYKISNIITNDLYVGSSSRITRRWDRHRSELKRGIHPNKHLLNSWNKYGEENFKFEVIEELDFPISYDNNIIREFLESREEYYINLLKPQFNKRLIVNSNFGMSVNSDKDNGMYGTGKKVKQYTKDMKLVREWISSAEVERILPDYNRSHVLSCCKGSRKTHKNFIWKFA